MRLMVCGLMFAALAVSGCSADDKQISGPEPTPKVSTSSGVTPAIVGEWQRTQKCQELVGVLTKNGMKDTVLPSLAEDGWIPGVNSPEQIKDPAHPCRGAPPRKHSHFFTADGQFGSRDANGQQVDSDPYRITAPNTVVIGDPGVEFHFTITDNDTIAFDPVIPDCAPSCFEAQWSVSVAYPGYTWERIG